MSRRIASKTFRLQYLVSLEFGVPPQEDLQYRDIEDPDATVPDATVYAHLEAVAQHLGERTGAFVVALARQHRITSVGLPGFAMRTAPTLRQGLTSLLRYQHLTNTLARFDLLEHDAMVVWSEERFGSLVDNSSDIVTIVDDHGHLTYVSPVAVRLLGYPSDFRVTEPMS